MGKRIFEFLLKMDGYPVLQIVRCQFGGDVGGVGGGGNVEYPFGSVGTHSHLSYPANHAHLAAYRYTPSHPYGTMIIGDSYY